MSNSALGSLAFFLFATLISAHFLGNLFVKFRQPKVIGEILAGVLMGPSLCGHFWQLVESSSASASSSSLPTPLELCYWIGLLLLMFFSGAETQHLFGRNDNREITLLALLGTGLPFIIALGFASLVNLRPLAGASSGHASLTLVIGIAVAVTSIPVISRIFHDLGILHTRFARLVLGVAVIEDIALWAVLAIATALAKSSASGGVLPVGQISREIFTTLVFFALGLTLIPRLMRRFHKARWNSLGSASPAAYLLILLFAYVAVAAALNVSLVFAAFLAGFAVPKPSGTSESDHAFCEALKSVKTVSFSIFIPLYFALVGYKIDWSKSFSLTMLLGFLAAACLIKLASVTMGAYAAGFRGLDAVNLAVATNARGGPGIVLASVAFDAQIISPAFYTTLILVAVFTSQAAGAWLEYVLRKGWPLLSGSLEATAPEHVLEPVPVQRAA